MSDLSEVDADLMLSSRLETDADEGLRIEPLDHLEVGHGIARRVVTWLGGFDALLTPALAEAPVTLGTIDPCGEDPWSAFRRSGRFTPFTALFNITGSPAITLPLYQRGDGLPLAVQLVGQPAQEGRLLALAAQLEQAQPWAERRPPIS